MTMKNVVMYDENTISLDSKFSKNDVDKCIKAAMIFFKEQLSEIAKELGIDTGNVVTLSNVSEPDSDGKVYVKVAYGIGWIDAYIDKETLDTIESCVFEAGEWYDKYIRIMNE